MTGFKRIQSLCHKVWGKESSFLRLDPIFGDASGRRYFRAVTGSKTLVLMQYQVSEAAEKGGNPDVLGTFINAQKRLKRQGLPVPETYERTEFELLIEDLGDQTLFKEISQNPMKTETLYRDSISLWGQFRKIPLSNEDRVFSVDFMEAEFQEFLEEMPRFSGVKLPESELWEKFQMVLKDLKELPLGPMHRDWQSKNLMINRGKLYIIDFQDFCKGPYIYDMVALLRDSYVELSSYQLNLLLEFLHETVFSEQFSFERLKKDFFLQALQRKIKDSGRFCTIDRKKGNPSFCQYIPLTLKYVAHAAQILPHYELYDPLKPLFKWAGVN